MFFFCCCAVKAQSADKECIAHLKNDTLVLSNSVAEQKWIWNGGNISLHSIGKPNSKEVIRYKTKSVDFSIEGISFVKNLTIKTEYIKGNYLYPEHLEVQIENQYTTLQSKRVFCIYPGLSTISSTIYLKYDSLNINNDTKAFNADGTESSLNKVKNSKSYLTGFGLSGKNHRVTVVDFKDATDVNNNIVSETEILPYTASKKLNGNLLFNEDLQSKVTFFVLKEAPLGYSQVNYPGYDFEVSQSNISCPVSGFSSKGNSLEWQKGYTFTTGFATDKEMALLKLRQYLKKSVAYNPDSYEMIMMNTWGDRGRDGRINESFIITELKKAKQLGITHFQIDDGWQQGLSSNSADKSGKLWNKWTPENWQPHSKRFPKGLTPVAKYAKQLGIKLGLWFHPSNENSYASWQSDADIVINLYKQTGISYFKIDGIELEDKLAETNLLKFFEKVKQQTSGAVFFNLDLTAGTRGGYFYYRPFGNLFLENRYTDWGNYYPYQTLRNIWMLSKYFPPELLQAEFLNKWRNTAKYADTDLFAPKNCDFEYLFATTMAAQPLAWFEATQLPDEADKIADVISKYRAIQTDFHSGSILPIGEEPSGTSWTGFQSVVNSKSGYFIFFREKTDTDTGLLKTWLKKGTKIKCTPIAGSGKEMTQTIDESGNISVSLAKENSYAFYKYEIISN